MTLAQIMLLVEARNDMHTPKEKHKKRVISGDITSIVPPMG